ncbi:MAG: hypothetical protein LKJ80_05130 [Oscillibacter sp.]|nr:hypothetical protein [Oscillibacter sp.]
MTEKKETAVSPRARARRRLWITAAILLPLILTGLWFRLYYRAFFSSAQPAFRIPGLSDGFVPQGLEACGDGSFLLSGYIASTGSSRIYYMGTDGTSRSVRVCDENGTTLISHSGGICTNGPFTYLAGGKGKCYVLSSADLFDPASREANILGVIKTDNSASFCCMSDDGLLVGEYEFGRFKTSVSHHITTPAGDGNTAVVLSYPLDGDQPFGVFQTPDAAYSVPERVQGMSFTDDGRIILSASSFQASSRLLLYDRAAVASRQGIFWTGGTAVPLYYLDRDSSVSVIPLPPYSEGTVYSYDWLFVMFESASRRFQFGKLIGAQNVYRMLLPAWNPDS